MNDMLETLGRWTWHQTMLAWYTFAALSPASLAGIIVLTVAAGQILLRLAQASTRPVRLLCSIGSAAMHLCGTVAGFALFAAVTASRLSWIMGILPIFHA